MMLLFLKLLLSFQIFFQDNIRLASARERSARLRERGLCAIEKINQMQNLSGACVFSNIDEFYLEDTVSNDFLGFLLVDSDGNSIPGK